jgi:hypothetical protein
LEFENQVLKAVPYGFTNYDYNNNVYYKQTDAVTRFNTRYYPVTNNLTPLIEVVASIRSIKLKRSTFNTSEKLNKMKKTDEIVNKDEEIHSSVEKIYTEIYIRSKKVNVILVLEVKMVMLMEIVMQTVAPLQQIIRIMTNNLYGQFKINLR